MLRRISLHSDFTPPASEYIFDDSTPTATATLTPSRIPTVSPTPVAGLNQTVIDYDYDPLYRLTAAEYTSGDYYHYTYDAVGNRLIQEKSITGLVTTDTYVYDDANRLKTMTGPSVAASYAYNGLGDRLQEIINGQPTTFTMDLNTGLTQALSDGTNTYVYGVDRIAQINTGTEYFLGDALGSVRQLTNSSGAVTYASAYDPYGVVTQTYGASETSYGYTNEYTDSYIKLIYLRSRWYDPASGRLLTRDSWQGDYNRPLTLNLWNYTSSNPINYTDPSGNFAVLCGPDSPAGWCFEEIVIFPGLVIYLPVPCDDQNQQLFPVFATPTTTPQPATPTPQSGTTTPKPTDDDLTTVKAWRGLSGSAPSDLKGLVVDDPSKAEPMGGMSVFEAENPQVLGYKKGLPFLITYQGTKKPLTIGTVVGILPDNTNYAFAGGVGQYTPDAGMPGHWTITIRGMTKDQVRRAILDYAEKYFGKKYPWP